MDPPDWAVPMVLISSLIIGITFVVSKILEERKKEKAEICSLIIFSVSFFTFILGFWGLSQNTEPTGLYQYEAHIEQGVDMAEFFEKYDIILVEDDILLFKDKVAESGDA